MRRQAMRLFFVLLAVSAFLLPARAGVEVYAAMGVDKNDVLSGTQLNARVLAGGDKQIVCLVTYLTGKRDKEEAVDVKLGVFRRQGDRLVSVYSRNYGKSYAGLVGDGNLEVLDLDRDGIAEIIVSFDSYTDPLVEQRLAEVLLLEDENFRVGWAGPLEYDATRAARNIPVERRDRYVREIDLVSTLRTRGVTLFFEKHMIAVAGEPLAEPKVVQETFPLRPREGF